MEEWQEIHEMIYNSMEPSMVDLRGELQPGKLTNAPLLFRIHNYLQKQLQTYKELNGEMPAKR